ADPPRRRVLGVDLQGRAAAVELAQRGADRALGARGDEREGEAGGRRILLIGIEAMRCFAVEVFRYEVDPAVRSAGEDVDELDRGGDRLGDPLGVESGGEVGAPGVPGEEGGAELGRGL